MDSAVCRGTWTRAGPGDTFVVFKQWAFEPQRNMELQEPSSVLPATTGC
jgi:hypothetical protein